MMTPIPETEQLALLIAVSLLGFFLILLAIMIERWHRIFGSGSARFVTANASTNLFKKVQRLTAPGVQILMPAGHGLYPMTLSNRQRSRWERRVADWVNGGGTLTALITSPNEEGIKYWQSLVARLGSSLELVVLDAKTASTSDTIEITKLDKFHPTLICKGNERLGMWIENDHPPRSRVAYNVEYVAAKDIVDFQKARFDRYLRVLKGLIERAAHASQLSKIAS